MYRPVSNSRMHLNHKIVTVWVFGRQKQFRSSCRGVKLTAAWEVCYLKKSWRQKRRPSRAKHLSASGQPHSQHWTHLACHTRSRTFSRNRSRIGPSQPAHSSSIPAPTDELLSAAATEPGSRAVAGATVESSLRDFIQWLTVSQRTCFTVHCTRQRTWIRITSAPTHSKPSVGHFPPDFPHIVHIPFGHFTRPDNFPLHLVHTPRCWSENLKTGTKPYSWL